MKFERLQDKLTKGQFVQRRHYCITDKVRDFAKSAQYEAYKKARKQCPTMADIYYQLIIEGLKHADKADFRKLPNNHTVRIKLGNPINAKLFEVQEKINKTANIFSVAVCLMECAIDNQK
jgi:hypothetical protein